MANELKLYEQKNCLTELTLIDLGRVEAGDTKTVSVFVKNDAPNKEYFLVGYKTEPDVEDIEIVGPETLKPRSVNELKITWNPDIDLEDALSVKLTLESKQEIRPV